MRTDRRTSRRTRCRPNPRRLTSPAISKILAGMIDTLIACTVGLYVLFLVIGAGSLVMVAVGCKAWTKTARPSASAAAQNGSYIGSLTILLL